MSFQHMALLLAACSASLFGIAACSSDSGSGSSGGTSSTIQNVTDAELMPLLAAANAGTPAAPASNTTAMIELGRALFYDKILSGNQDISCATCHHSEAAGGDNLPLSFGTGAIGSNENRLPSSMDPDTVEDQMIPRNAPTIFNLGSPGVDVMFLDGRVRMNPDGTFLAPAPELSGIFPTRPDYTDVFDSALAVQAMFPVTSREEMRGKLNESELGNVTRDIDVWELLMARLVGTNNGTVGGIAEYRAMFMAAYPNVTSYDDLNFAHAATAMAAFERHVYLSVNSPYDRYLAGDMNALTQQEKNGAALFFGEAGCSSCHNGPHLSDFDFHNTAMPQLGPGKEDLNDEDDQGLFLRTLNAADRYKFRTYPLRNVAETGPWGHDGAYTTLRGIVEHHLDPAQAALNYDPTQLPEIFRPYYRDDAAKIQGRINRLDPDFAAPKNLSAQEVDALIAFLHALTDTEMLANLPNEAPDTVPSGLPVAD